VHSEPNPSGILDILPTFMPTLVGQISERGDSGKKTLRQIISRYPPLNCESGASSTMGEKCPRHSS
jgi:hypothetical protein